jgi:hypothetical protein
MDQWWKRHSDIDMAGHDKSEVEDITGCIPLLLDKCVVNGKINFAVKDRHNICDKAVSFTYEIKYRTTGYSLQCEAYVSWACISQAA